MSSSKSSHAREPWAAVAGGALLAAGLSYLGYKLYTKRRGSRAACAAADAKDSKAAPVPAVAVKIPPRRAGIPESLQPTQYIPRGPVAVEECIVPEAPSPARRLRVVVVHGDPSKPNRILPGGWWDDDDYDAVNSLKEALCKLTHSYDFEFLCRHDTVFDDLKQRKREGKVDIVMQFCDEGLNNDPRQELHMTALLETLKIPFTGTGAHNIAFSYDKDFVLNVCKSLKVPIPESQYFAPHQDPLTHTLPYPVLVKPNGTDGSYGITSKSVCHSAEDLRHALAMIRDTFKLKNIGVLVQEFLPGKDVNFAILGNPVPGTAVGAVDEKQQLPVNADGSWTGVGSIRMPVTEEDYSDVDPELPRVLGFESKWLPGSPYWRIKTVATKLSAAQQQLIIDCSHRLFQRLGYRDYARFDWRCDAAGNPRLLEVNPNCGWCWDGHLAKTAATAGIDYANMMDRILRTAWARHQQAVRDRISNAPANMDELVQQLGAVAAGTGTEVAAPTAAGASAAAGAGAAAGTTGASAGTQPTAK